jgi:ABC-2 type transport system permease protein
VIDTLGLYGRYVAISLRGQLQYRASFLLQSLGIFLITGIEFFGIWALFHRFGQVRGWTMPQVALMYGMISVTFAISDAMARGFDLFGQTVKAGDFDRILLRPRSTVLQLLGQELTLRRVGRFAQGMLVLIYAAAALDIDWNVGRMGLMVFSIACGVCLFSGLVILQASSAFWTTESLEVWNAFTYGGVTMSQYPMAIYRPWFRQFFTYVIPLSCINYFPGVAILGRDDPVGTPLWLQCVAPLAGPAFLLLSLSVWRVGVRHYRSTGS